MKLNRNLPAIFTPLVFNWGTLYPVSPRQIIDKHFTDNYEYYKRECKRYYPKGEMSHELLHEAYVYLTKVKDEAILEASAKDYMNPLILKCIKIIYLRRGRKKSNVNGQTSPLYEEHNLMDCEEWLESNEVEHERSDELNDVVVEVTKTMVFNGLASEDFDTGVFVMSQIESFRQMSARSGINRTKLTSANERFTNKLKKEVERVISKLE